MPTDLFDCSEEVAVVIGATGVLGGSLAEGLAAQGAKVAICGRRENAEQNALSRHSRSRWYGNVHSLRRADFTSVKPPKPP